MTKFKTLYPDVMCGQSKNNIEGDANAHSRLAYFEAEQIHSPRMKERVCMSSGCTQDSTGCISGTQAYKIHKVAHLTGGCGIPLTFPGSDSVKSGHTVNNLTLDTECQEILKI